MRMISIGCDDRPGTLQFCWHNVTLSLDIKPALQPASCPMTNLSHLDRERKALVSLLITRRWDRGSRRGSDRTSTR
jgi:hypothetical protein